MEFVVGDASANDGGVIECAFPLTGRTCVSRVITELGVFDVNFEKGLTLVEIAKGVEVMRLGPRLVHRLLFPMG